MEEWMLAAQLGPNQPIPTIALGRRECDISFDWTLVYEKYKEYGSIPDFRNFLREKSRQLETQQDHIYDFPSVTFSAEQSQLIDHMKIQIEHLKTNNTTLKNCVSCKRTIVQGKAGTGKSLLIRFLTSSLHSQFGDSSYLLLAPTGVSALNINGQTIHSALHIPINYKEYKPLTAQKARTFCDKLEHVKFLIIDEYSMIGLKLFRYLNGRCKQGKNSEEMFGGLYVYLFGDIKQHPPVKDTPVYNTPQKNTLASYGKAAFDSFEVAFFLTKSHRQNDVKFQDVLDNISTADMIMEDYGVLSSRFSTNLSQDEKHLFEEAIRLFPTIEEVESYNLKKLRSLMDETTNQYCPVARIPAKHNCPEAEKVSSENADSLNSVIYLAKNCKIMLRRNLWVKKGLVNGAVGKVVDILYDLNSDSVHDPPAVIMCEFESYSGPSIIPGKKIIPIAPMLKSWTTEKDQSFSRQQFPLALCYACSIHKSQGLTLQKAVIDLGKTEFQVGISYVALSRVKELKGLYLVPFNYDRIAKIKLSLSMITRLKFLKVLQSLGLGA